MKNTPPETLYGFHVITSFPTNSDDVDKRAAFYQLGKLLESYENRIKVQQLNKVEINNINKKSA